MVMVGEVVAAGCGYPSNSSPLVDGMSDSINSGYGTVWDGLPRKPMTECVRDPGDDVDPPWCRTHNQPWHYCPHRPLVDRLREGHSTLNLKANANELEAADEIERLRENLHYSNGCCDLAMKHRDEAEAEIERLRAEEIAHDAETDRAFSAGVVTGRKEREAENAKLREALKVLYNGVTQCWIEADRFLPETLAEARAALQKDEG